MKLYFAPLACSMATRISLYEAGVDAEYAEVDTKTRRTLDGEDFGAVNPLGLVPTVKTDEGDVLTENAAILQYVADRYPSAHLAPTDRAGRTRLQQWLSFVGTELHKGLFTPLLDAKAPTDAKAYASDKAPSRLGLLQTHLTGRDFVLDQFSVADAYLVTVLTWAAATPLKLANWPVLDAYVRRMRERPSVAKAFAEEREMYVREKARAQSAS